MILFIDFILKINSFFSIYRFKKTKIHCLFRNIFFFEFKIILYLHLIYSRSPLIQNCFFGFINFKHFFNRIFEMI
jgi:hypothetical protein